MQPILGAGEGNVREALADAALELRQDAPRGAVSGAVDVAGGVVLGRDGDVHAASLQRG